MRIIQTMILPQMICWAKNSILRQKRGKIVMINHNNRLIYRWIASRLRSMSRFCMKKSRKKDWKGKNCWARTKIMKIHSRWMTKMKVWRKSKVLILRMIMMINKRSMILILRFFKVLPRKRLNYLMKIMVCPNKFRLEK